MERGFLRNIITNRKITLFVTALVFIAGMFSYMSSIKQESPDFEVPYAIISFTYLGASASEVEEFVVRPMEDTFKQVEDVIDYVASSRSNGGVMILELVYNADKDQAFDEIRRRLSDLQPSLPDDVEITDIMAGELTVTDFMYVLTGPDGELDMQKLELYANDIKNEIGNMDMVKTVHIQGQKDSQVQVTVDNDTLETMSISHYDIGQLIESMDSRLPGGIMTGDTSLAVQNNSALTSSENIENLILGANPMTGVPITLGQIAEVENLNNESIYTNYDGKQGLIIYGYYNDGLDLTDFAESFEMDINLLAETLPDGYNLEQIIYYPNDVKASNNDFFINLLIGIGLVIIISFFSMGIRNAIVVSFAIPTSVFLTLSIMYGFGIKLHQISIASLIISIGMLVDNAIVITESIKRKLEEGMARLEGTVAGTKEVAIPVLTSTLTTIAAFSPLMFIPSVAGDYIKNVPQVIIIALLSSYLVSITVMPCLSYMIFNHMDHKKQKNTLFEIVGKAVNILLKRKVVVLISIILVAVLSVFALDRIGLSFFPTADKDIMFITVKDKEGITIEQTKEKMEVLETFIAENDNISHYIMTVGGSVPRFWDTMRPYSPSADFGQFLIEVDLLDDFESNSDFAGDLQAHLNALDSSLNIEVNELEKSEPVLAPITIEVNSDELDAIHDAKTYTVEILEGIEGVTFIRDDEASRTESLEVNYDMDAILSNGLALPLVQAEVAYAINGRTVASINDDNVLVPVVVKGSITNKADLEGLIVGRNQLQEAVQLVDVANISSVSGMSYISRHNGAYTVYVLANVLPGYSSGDIIAEFKNQLDMSLYPEVSWQYAGEQESITSNFGDVGYMAMIAMFLILTILVLQFKSFGQVFIIIVSIPFAAVGAVFGLYFTGYPVSFTALLGIVSLMGIVVNNAILLVDSINIRRREGLNVHDAAVEGSKKRIRPILLTTLTTIIGLSPLIFSNSEMFAPMAIAIGAGLIFSTLITLLVIPILYQMFIKN